MKHTAKSLAIAALCLCMLLVGIAPALSEAADPAFAPYETTLKLTIGQSVDSTYTFPDGYDWENNPIINDAKEALNLDITDYWQAQSGTDFDQRSTWRSARPICRTA